MKRFVALLSIIASIAILTVGCGKNGDKYIGKWIPAEKSSIIQLEIQRNGESFIVTQTDKSFWDGKPKASQFPASLKNDGVLSVNIMGLSMDLAYVKDSDSILFGGKKFNRQTQSSQSVQEQPVTPTVSPKEQKQPSNERQSKTSDRTINVPNTLNGGGKGEGFPDFL